MSSVSLSEPGRAKIATKLESTPVLSMPSRSLALSDRMFPRTFFTSVWPMTLSIRPSRTMSDGVVVPLRFWICTSVFAKTCEILNSNVVNVPSARCTSSAGVPAPVIGPGTVSTDTVIFGGFAVVAVLMSFVTSLRSE